MKIIWDESYSIGHEEIDKQHQVWIGFYNRLDDVMSSSSAMELHDAKSEILTEMSEYASYHYLFEEEYMRKIGFPDVDKHWRQHKDFGNKIYQIHRKHKEGRFVLNSELMDMIKKWIDDHILKDDMEIRRFVESQKR